MRSGAERLRPIRSIAELPFRRRDPLDLLHLRRPGDAPDPDYAGFGWALVDTIRLRGRDEPGVVEVQGALVLALHAADDGAALPDDVELEFCLDELEPGFSVTVRLSAFLRRWLPLIWRGKRPIVLALCNPHRAALPVPEVHGVPGAVVHYALGDVASWLDPDGGLRLTADAWRLAAPAPEGPPAPPSPPPSPSGDDA